MEILLAFKRWLFRECPGKGKQATLGMIRIDGDGHIGVCPECHKERQCDPYSMMLKHRK